MSKIRSSVVAASIAVALLTTAIVWSQEKSPIQRFAESLQDTVDRVDPDRVLLMATELSGEARREFERAIEQSLAGNAEQASERLNSAISLLQSLSTKTADYVLRGSISESDIVYLNALGYSLPEPQDSSVDLMQEFREEADSLANDLQAFVSRDFTQAEVSIALERVSRLHTALLTLYGFRNVLPRG